MLLISIVARHKPRCVRDVPVGLKMPPRRGQSPASRSKSPPTRSMRAQAKASPIYVTKAVARPPYFSDGDSRPHCRGLWYAWIRDSGVAWLVLSVYFSFSVIDVFVQPRWVLLVCRLFHICAMIANVILSDELHNLDHHLGRRYTGRSAKSFEQALHARDWRAALAVPASYHILLVCGIMDHWRVCTVDCSLLVANLAACVVMCVRIRPSRITPKRELFLSFVITFGMQMLLLLMAFWRERNRHGLWLPLWGIYAIGLVAKAAEVPDSPYFGHRTRSRPHIWCIRHVARLTRMSPMPAQMKSCMQAAS